ncbi:helix-turn-helix domain-containing protein [Hymenobacter cellulosivorans]|uniref:Helix-turn-helix domain-containing protein n=1 Tax=Hymenobacter cellulosivorans TaxID=2932249 RepID=A0ABY4FG57_9BACT|nr:helix-turn-helix transcriptional regulator [Hymenobacter cellulosivorans]UOQ55641.1 helix-turn-helix domain-containing protein [Hymenobacter cellulosivorans]
MQTLNEKVRAIRLLKGITQEKAGQHLGTTKANYNRIEKGHVDVSPAKLTKLAELFEMSREEIQNFQSEKDQAVAEVDQLKQEADQLKQEIARLKGYISQADDLLTESQTFFSYFFQLLLHVFPQDGENAVSLSQLNQEWSKLVSYSLQEYEAHRHESPLGIAKQRDLDSAVMGMRQQFFHHNKGKIQ